MAVGAWEEIPQIVAIAPVSRDGKVNLKKVVRQHLDLDRGQALWLDTEDEVLLTTDASRGKDIPFVGSSRVQLPEGVLVRLGLGTGSLAGLVQRPSAVAVKAVEIVEAAADRARLVDVESAGRIVRRVETTPLPDDLLPRLANEQQGWPCATTSYPLSGVCGRWQRGRHGGSSRCPIPRTRHCAGR